MEMGKRNWPSPYCPKDPKEKSSIRVFVSAKTGKKVEILTIRQKNPR